MTYRSRRKRRTIAPARSTWRRMAASLVGLGLLAGQAAAQDAPRRFVPPPNLRTTETPPPPLAGPAPPVERIRPVAAGPEIQVAAWQQPGGMLSQPAGSSDYSAIDLLVEPPGPLRVFRLDSEAAFKERMRQEAKEGRLSNQSERIEFPDVPVI